MYSVHKRWKNHMEIKVIKRNDTQQDFNLKKIENAIKKANASVSGSSQIDDSRIEKVMNTITKSLKGFHAIGVEDIQDITEKALIRHNCADVAKSYILYREKKKKKKKFSDIEEKAQSLAEGTSNLRGDNANKNIDDNGALRDYFAGLVSKSVTDKKLPKDVKEMNSNGQGHFHDADYFLNPQHNCDLLDVDDMMKNKFQMLNTLIEPNIDTSFSTACNLLAQINLIVSGRQYGGQTISWSHLLTFINNSRRLFRHELINHYLEEEPIIKKARKLMAMCHIYTGIYNKEKFRETIEKKVRNEIYQGVKTYQYQILCHSSSNGQTPFVSNNLCLREAETEQELKDFAILIEEILKRRIKGIKDPSGHYKTPLFPKLLYWTCDGLNVKEGDPFFYLTELAAKSMAERMQPDIVSEKVTRRVKKGQIIPSMGCRSLLAPIWEMTEYPVSKKFYYEYTPYRALPLTANIQDLTEEEYKRIQYPYTKWTTLQSFEEVRNGEYAIGTFCINFRGNTGWLIRKDNDKVYILQPKVYGRWNNGVFTLNIPHIALTASGNTENKSKAARVEDFIRILDERMAVARKALVERYKRCCRIKAKNSSILWEHGALARIKADETVEDLMERYPQRASMSLGFVGLYETCQALIGESNTSPDGRNLCRYILTYMNNRLNQWKKEGDIIHEAKTIEITEEVFNNIKNSNGNYKIEHQKVISVSERDGKYFADLADTVVHINYSIYGTPEESLTYKFALANRRDFGLIEHITDKDYVVNSYHVDPREIISITDKLTIEGEYLDLVTGGAVSYVEMNNNIKKNKKAVIDIIQFMHEHILYAEINRMISVCFDCGDDNIELVKAENGQFTFRCKTCGNTNQERMTVDARVCGYLGEVTGGNVNQGRMDDIFHRKCNTDIDNKVE